jgi:3'-phosphoadenosine 5'-phosphosulfate sulfotransferase (PAPS reductase)/FAD synthetase
MAKEKFGCVTPVYCDTRSEHPDNARFRREVEEWLGVTVQVITSDKFYDVDDVFEKTRWLRGPNGARCTTELKKVPRLDFQHPDDKHIFGYTFEEGNRIARLLAENWDLRIECPLYSAKLKKQDCLQILHEAGIEIPMMYRLGFNNNNCIGCVKAEGAAYWNNVRKHFPEIFEKRAKQERELNYALTRVRKKPVFLDELDPNNTTGKNEKLSCDFLCGSI